MKIGFDLDGIFIGTPPLVSRKLLERFYKTKSKGKLRYRIPSYPEQLFRKLTHLPFLRPPLKENISFLKSLSQKGHTLYLITSRYTFLEKETRSFLKRYGLDKTFDTIYLNKDNQQAHLFKDAVVKELNLDIHIDDDIALINFIAKENPKTKFYWFNPEEEKKSLAKNVFSIVKLEEILKDVRLKM
jgi:hypothetical protein